MAAQKESTAVKKKVLILGSTGSIGTSALKVAYDIPDRMEVVGLAACRSADALVQQVRDTGVKWVAVTDAGAAAQVRSQLPADVTIFDGERGLVDIVQACGADMVLVAIVGTAGLAPALAAVEEGMDLAVASKEILVMAGEAVMGAAQRKGVNILPVDSEHNAIFQCLEGHRHSEVRRILLTASGGPFRTLPADQLEAVTVEAAQDHHRLRHAFQQRPGNDRGEVALRCADEQSGSRRASSVHRPQYGGVHGQQCHCAAQPFRHVFPHPVCGDLARTRRELARSAGLRTTRRAAF